tara:strand:+ start:327 stop:719 length:393 start_codon:yes stop_codon:yes gene_type:complete
MAQVLSAASVKTPVKKVSAKAKKAPVKATKSNIGTLVPKPTVTGKGASRKQYKYTGKYPENVDKTTPQIVGLVDTVESAEKGELDSSSFTAQDLVALAVKKGFLSTRQDPLRIFRFYRKRLIDEGYFIEL